jgi:hypothetical protein
VRGVGAGCRHGPLPRKAERPKSFEHEHWVGCASRRRLNSRFVFEHDRLRRAPDRLLGLFFFRLVVAPSKSLCQGDDLLAILTGANS